ncbi:hypothetical protein FOA52_003940 [Chlamydomonas sp. UWO 241]|nr:hypothetical protein FOA52_003940 [Chlamydomonas sp. UWO 241]
MALGADAPGDALGKAVERESHNDSVLLRGGSWSSMSTFDRSLGMDNEYGSEEDKSDGSPSPKPRLSGDSTPSTDSKSEHEPQLCSRSAFEEQPRLLRTAHADASPAASTTSPAATTPHSYAPAALLASLLVTIYDLLLRSFMTSHYVVGLDGFATAAEYLGVRAIKKTRRFVESSTKKYAAVLEGDVAVRGVGRHHRHAQARVQCRWSTHTQTHTPQSGAIIVTRKPAFDVADVAFATAVLHGKHGMPLPLVWAWRGFASLLSASPGAMFTTVTDAATGQIVGLFMEFRQGSEMHHFITALVDADASREHGIYIAKYEQLLSSCTHDKVPLLRLGPTTDELKVGLGAISLPMLVVGSAVWGRWEGRCSVVCFGIFTSVALSLWVAVTQWVLDASGVGALSVLELVIIYACCITCVKLLPLWSIGLVKVFSNPKKYLVQTSFYAQGVIPGAVVGIGAVSLWRTNHPFALIDGLALFLLVGELIGRLGCHFYGCCFGMPATRDASVYARWAVMYLHPSSSVARLRPEFMLRPLLPTQVLQAAFAALCQAAILFTLASFDASPFPVGMVAVAALGLYSVGRLIFFSLREDENFKTNRSYTTAYMALGTIAMCAAIAAYSVFVSGQASPVNLASVRAGAADVTASAIVSHLALALALGVFNFVLQGLHHHERVGQFPDIARLLSGAPSLLSSAASPGARTVGDRSRSSKGTQVFSSWEGAAPRAALAADGAGDESSKDK